MGPLSAYLSSSEMLISPFWIDHFTDYDNQKINSNEQCQHRKKLIVTDYLQTVSRRLFKMVIIESLRF